MPPESQRDRPAVAIVHDYFTQQGGAERLVGELARLFPDAPVHTSMFDADRLPDRLPASRLRPTRLQPWRRRGVPLSAFAPVLPAAFGRIRFDGERVVLSSTSAFAHHVRPPDGAIHVSYCHAPPHFLWEPDEYFRGRPVRRRLFGPLLELQRRADREAARRVDVRLANSRYTSERARRAYGGRVRVVHPPIDTMAFAPTADRSGRFLVVSRLRRHKRLDLAIAAATRYGWPLDLIGDGPDQAVLRRDAGPTVRFLGRRPDAEVREAMASCVALVVPGIEDFGMTMAEVQAAGRPPLAYGIGGALEIVEDGRTGFLVERQTVAAVAEAMRRALEIELDPVALVAAAKRFDRAIFDAAIEGVVRDAVAQASR